MSSLRSPTIIPSIAITSNDVTRVLMLDGEKGSVGCRVHGKQLAQALPSLSPAYTIETSLRTRLRVQNLIAVRGVPGEGMIGPGDYYGNWDNPDNHNFSISIQNGFPTIYQHAASEEKLALTRPVIKADLTEVKVSWISGTDKAEMERKKNEYESQGISTTGDSLFKNAGLLEINEPGDIHLKWLNAKALDLTPFKARLVDNSRPFKIASDHIGTNDTWRAVSYQFDPGYATRQIEHGGGLFLETHHFAQSMTPLDQSAGGYVMLGKWKDPVEKDVLEMIAVTIPYNSTLIIEKGCIHGDTTLDGMYMMCMTSDHVTMNSADTVFLKQTGTKKNINVTLEEKPPIATTVIPEPGAPKPLVMYNDIEDYDAFCQQAKGLNFMFNPLSAGWWKYERFAVHSGKTDALIKQNYDDAYSDLSEIVKGLNDLLQKDAGQALLTKVKEVQESYPSDTALLEQVLNLSQALLSNPKDENTQKAYHKLSQEVGQHSWGKIIASLMLALVCATLFALCCTTATGASLALPVISWGLNYLVPTALGSGLGTVTGVGFFAKSIQQDAIRNEVKVRMEAFALPILAA